MRTTGLQCCIKDHRREERHLTVVCVETFTEKKRHFFTLEKIVNGTEDD